MNGLPKKPTARAGKQLDHVAAQRLEDARIARLSDWVQRFTGNYKKVADGRGEDKT